MTHLEFSVLIRYCDYHDSLTFVLLSNQRPGPIVPVSHHVLENRKEYARIHAAVYTIEALSSYGSFMGVRDPKWLDTHD